MRWLCWFVSHKWFLGLDPTVEACDRCDKVRRARPKLPPGTRECPYPDCSGWLPLPDHTTTSNTVMTAVTKVCGHCSRRVRWERDVWADGGYKLGAGWPDPRPLDGPNAKHEEKP
jgi:hypothetical protein